LSFRLTDHIDVIIVNDGVMTPSCEQRFDDDDDDKNAAFYY